MAKVDEKNLEVISGLYKLGLSIREIACKYSVSVDAMFYFFRKHKIKRRTAKESNKFLFERKKASFYIKKKLSIKEESLKTAGIMLYWAEGSKWDGEKIVDFANSDSDMIKTFLVFLREICGVDESKLRVYLYCFSNQDVDRLKKFWSKETDINLNQFTKPYIKKDYNLSKTSKMKHGLIHIRYNDKKLLQQIRNWIEEYKNKYN
ncbi:MAG: hypothetical protein ABIJ23_01180 [Candidatus Magasanikbacteria bacterium]